MVGKVLISHGGLAQELLRAATRILGPLPEFAALNVGWDEATDEVRERIRLAIEKADQGDGVLVLVDMFGNTPCKIALELCLPGKTELIAGVNLPLVVRLGCMRTDNRLSLAEVAGWVRDKARRSICLGSGAEEPGAGSSAPGGSDESA